ncbi:MAG: hypothetical protein NZ988_05555 [Thaumarchaeota archaeon]|nr:hypothetical protein [Candidatus Calditenuaceae archaeon]MDW8187488.1 hypothetical protein [Nitrososphaerota archaeon]
MEVSVEAAILIAVTVVAAVAVAFWASGFVAQVTPFERLEIIGARTVDGRTIEFTVKNPGVAVSSISAVELMGRVYYRLPSGIDVGTGAVRTCVVRVNGDLPVGASIELVVITSTGKRFPTVFMANHGGFSGPFATNVESVHCV